MQWIELNFDDGYSRLKYGMLNGLRSDCVTELVLACLPLCHIAGHSAADAYIVMVYDNIVSQSRLAVMASVCHDPSLHPGCDA
ncbi:hypothetical protein HAX54_009890, partial [Datura stramonium]|nr:hypothetical protein [Datura stramonium]